MVKTTLHDCALAQLVVFCLVVLRTGERHGHRLTLTDNQPSSSVSCLANAVMLHAIIATRHKNAGVFGLQHCMPVSVVASNLKFTSVPPESA